MARIHPVFHVSVRRKHTANTIKGRGGKPAAPIVVDGNVEWEVEEILNCRKKGKKREYFVS